MGVDLDAIYDEFTDDLAPDNASEQFVPSTPEEFEWAIRKRTAAKHEREEWEQHKTYELRLLADKFDKRIEAAQREQEFFEGMIERGMKSVTPDSKGRRTVKTVAGTAFVARHESWVWPAAELDVYRELAAFALDHNAARIGIDKAALKALVKETGEALPGVEITHPESVTIREA